MVRGVERLQDNSNEKYASEREHIIFTVKDRIATVFYPFPIFGPVATVFTKPQPRLLF